jgi:ferredoxin
MAEALEAYTHGDDTFAREVFGGDTVIGRTLVHETALGDDARPDVLDWERASAVVEDARSWAVALCYCRHKAEHLGQRCDAPMDVCLSLDAGADFVIRREFGRAIERSEAMDIMVRSRASGLVQIADNVLDRPAFICNCCGCCCGQLQAINEYDLPAVNPSGFLPRSDASLCSGCARCSRACPVGAITMIPTREAAKRKNTLAPVIADGRCIGCGVCVGACKRDAMGMDRRPEQPEVPRNALEKSLRMAIERGHLGHLLFDEGTTRGPRFLTGALQALFALPKPLRALASKQLTSRFVRAALARVPDPTAR